MSTYLSVQFALALRPYLALNPVTVDSRTHIAAGCGAVLHEVARLLALFASRSVRLFGRFGVPL